MTQFKPTPYIGTVGFSYDAWANGTFYPSDLPRSKWLSFYSQYFNSVEIAHTFSKVPEKEVFQQWYEQSPEGFRFSLRGNQYITHVKKLKGVGEPLKLFMEPALKLKEKLSSIVWDVPKLGRDQTKLFEAFLKHLQKYPHIRHFFDFSDEMVIEQATLQLLKDHSCENLVKIPQDSLVDNQHYFRVCLQEGGLGEEWENDLFRRIQSVAPTSPTYVFFEGPQSGNAFIRAKSFIQKLKAQS